MVQHELFELDNLFSRLDKDPLVELNKIVDWKSSDAPLKKFFDSIPHKSDAHRNVIVQPLIMFNFLVLQSLYNLSDTETEHLLNHFGIYTVELSRYLVSSDNVDYKPS